MYYVEQSRDRLTWPSYSSQTLGVVARHGRVDLRSATNTRSSLPERRIYTVFRKKRDHIFDDKLKQNYPFIKIFGTLITKSIGHRQVYLVSHLTYFVHLLYFGKLSRPKYHEFSFKFLIFSMLQY